MCCPGVQKIYFTRRKSEDEKMYIKINIYESSYQPFLKENKLLPFRVQTYKHNRTPKKGGGGGATVPIFKTQLRSVFPGPPMYFTDFIFCMVISYYHIRMGI